MNHINILSPEDGEYSYIIYETINLINNKKYIGQHRTKNINDDYIGSGTELKKDIEEFGRINFKKTILYIFNNFEEMNDMEKHIVNEDYVSRDDTYNIALGGSISDAQRIRRKINIYKKGIDGIRELFTSNEHKKLREKFLKYLREAYKNHESPRQITINLKRKFKINSSYCHVVEYMLKNNIKLELF